MEKINNFIFQNEKKKHINITAEISIQELLKSDSKLPKTNKFIKTNINDNEYPDKVSESLIYFI